MGRDETLDSGEVLVPAPHLRRFAESVFSQLGMTPEQAFLMADQITWAHLRGHSSMGARKIIQYGTTIKDGLGLPPLLTPRTPTRPTPWRWECG